MSWAQATMKANAQEIRSPAKRSRAQGMDCWAMISIRSLGISSPQRERQKGGGDEKAGISL